MGKKAAPKWQIGLSEKELAFVVAYRENEFNGVKALIALGHNPVSAGQRAYEIRNRSHVARAIAESIWEDPTQLRTLIVDELTAQLKSNPMNAYKLDEDGRIVLTNGKPTLRDDLRPEHLAGVVSIDVGKKRTRFKFADKQGAARILARHVGLSQEAPVPALGDEKALTPDVELARAIAFLLTRAAKQGASG